MSDTPQSAEARPPSADQSEHQTVLFSNLLMQQFSMAMMLMGRTPGPPGESAMKRDLEAARLFIDQVEMLEAKTKGNLFKEEEGLLKQTLMTLRMAFVEAVEEEQKPAEGKATQSSPAPAIEPSPAPQEESHKKFTKKY